ncbi:hypothetical protein A1Q1_03044 [Trichosporon asahii var. asahii CBS 2479]|uniref:Uncharacterized protein n=1 Tax=Trichosporon asahii var. asahii (strain ATCC 90039 / CBS 2479 / JCM 2466 / KCTC 7840 / NBRC 103889/ NCYC 2677 / UAMH 7654) TaxID=1186058 RepID=J5SXB3_TRIAS|nr:hypothetical protein A1Q1_03044 [Trichosporon asahii var. asahii CBS 2479]EJT48006.1 hypothetical protein A1Q1_03044 [Trichosporon asahii var. asahii CBS 2479]
MVITQGVASRVVRPSQSSAPGSGVDPPEMPESPAVDVSSRLATWFGPVATLPAVLTSPLWAIRDHLLHPESIYIPPVLCSKEKIELVDATSSPAIGPTENDPVSKTGPAYLTQADLHRPLP